MRRQKQIKSPVVRLKRKVLKKVNFLNISIAGICVFAGYMIVIFFTLIRDDRAEHNSFDEITKSAGRIADSFELYNQKKFLNAVVSKEQAFHQ